MNISLLSAALLSLISGSAFADKPTPADVLDLSYWSLSLPYDSTGSGKATTIKEKELAGGFSDPDYFYVNEVGDGVVFSSPIQGVLTSKNTTYTRSELREMGRRGDTSYNTKGVNKNNWVFSSAPIADQQKAGGVNGIMNAILSVDEVTTTGVTWQQGRVIVGQIHANDDEPVKLYYRKFPNHELGSVFITHEPRDGDDVAYPLLGTNVPDYYTQDGEVVEPIDGIKLGEKWSYQIKVIGNELTVTVRRIGKPEVVQVVDMSESRYDTGGQYMYFKAGAYNQNKTGALDERTTATFYDLKVWHGK
ncbi:polysaccharide lyase family 7 protein [bacterium]|nr:polysaccharide lyase family 7 protein [bacterium]